MANYPSLIHIWEQRRRVALVVGAGGTAAAWLLLKLIALFTNAVWFGRISVANVSLAGLHPWWVMAAPALAGLVIGLMARYGSEAIRGHRIPEAIEAILIGGSRMKLKVALLKPLSSAISIGSGGSTNANVGRASCRVLRIMLTLSLVDLASCCTQPCV